MASAGADLDFVSLQRGKDLGASGKLVKGLVKGNAMRALKLGCCLVVAACGSQADQPVRVEYASYEDCVLSKLGRGQSTAASKAIIEACRVKFQSKRTEFKPATEAAISPPIRKSGEPEIAESDDYYHDGQPISRTFEGYECTDDCSGHQAGWDWAKRKGITDPEDCRGTSRSFLEGCQAFAKSSE